MGCSGSSTAKNTNNYGTAEMDRFKRIADKYETFEEVQAALRKAGLESSNLVIAIDYTKSNTWTGQRTFNGKCLHEIDPAGFVINPYQAAISSVSRALEPFDDDHLIPVYGFGDATTGDKGVFPFYPDRYCQGLQEIVHRYNEITPQIALSGPTSFAPAINEAIRIVSTTKQYHILVIIADGQVVNEQPTRQAIVEASKFPLSIIVVGVGDGPWECMKEFDDSLPKRAFDNFQFVEYNRVIQYNSRNADVGFAMAALMEIPDQYQALKKLGYL